MENIYVGQSPLNANVQSAAKINNNKKRLHANNSWMCRVSAVRGGRGEGETKNNKPLMNVLLLWL